MHLSPRLIFPAIETFYEGVYERWYIQVAMKQKWMDHVLRYGFQTYGFSCAFYLLAVARDMNGDQLAMKLVVYDKWDGLISERLGQFGERQYVESILTYAHEKGGSVADVSVFNFIGTENSELWADRSHKVGE